MISRFSRDDGGTFISARTGKDDWDQMVAELRGLPGPFAATAAPWLEQADARVAADHALAKVTAWAASRISGR